MNVPLLDLAVQYEGIRSEIQSAMDRVFASQQFILGPEVQALEEEIAAYVNTEYAVGVASGTDALTLGLRALNIGPGDEVIIPAYTFFATAEAVLHVGATPVFVDIREDTYCLDVAQVEARITDRTKAVIPVHLYGHPVDMEPLAELAAAKGLVLIEDNAQAMGAEYAGKKTGGIGDVGCLSFFPSKNLGGYGDGGMVVTNDSDIAERIRMLRTHGWKKKNFPEIVGYNSRLDALQAAILRVKLKHLDFWNEGRRERAGAYARSLSNLGIDIPKEVPPARHVFHLYVVQLSNREAAQQILRERGIASAVYYPAPIHDLNPCRRYAGNEKFPVAEMAADRLLAIPLFPEMSDDQITLVSRALGDAKGAD